MQSLLVSEALWSIVNGLLRVAAGLMIRRVFVSKTAVVGAWTIMTMSVFLSLASIMQIFMICRPFAAQWDPKVLGMCGDQVLSFTVMESIGLCLDISIILLPLSFIMGLQMTKWKRIKTILVLDLGGM